MDITRIDGDRQMNKSCHTLTICIYGRRYTFTERHGELQIHGHRDFIMVKPLYGNEVSVLSYDSDEITLSDLS